MQTTLLGLAVALIVAIISALAAPLFVDWSAHRYLFEARLSAVLGAPATIAGGIDAAILPTPQFTFRNVTAVRGGVLVTVAEARGSLALGALLRGEIEADEVVLVEPKVEVELDANGALAPASAVAGDLAVEQLQVQDATLTIHQRRAGRTLTITGIDATGQLRSLAGPFRLEGRTDANGTRTAFRLASGGWTEAGLRLRLTLQSGRPSIDVDGALHVEDGQPRFDGQIVVSRAGDDLLGRMLASGKVAATLDAVRFDTITLSTGPEERALELEGSARLDLGRKPRLDAVLGARQLDLDRAFGSEAGVTAPPLTVLAGLLANADLTEAAGLPIRLGLSADAVTLGGEAVRDVRLDLAGGRAAWTVEHFEAHLPGRANLRVAGDGGAQAGFQGLVALEADDPGQLMRWLDRSGAAPGARSEPLTLQAKVDLHPGRFELDDVKLAGAGMEMAGRLSWTQLGGRSQLAADLTGARLDLDALQSLARTAGLTAATALDGDVRLNLAFEALQHAGVSARRVEARLGWDAAAVRIDHLKVADYGGLSAEAEGQMNRRDGGLEGAAKLSLALDGTAGLDALAGGGAYPAALLHRLAGIAAPAKLTAEIATVDGRALKADARGKTAAGPLDLSVLVPLDQPAATTIRAELTTSAAKLLPLIGLDGHAGDGQLSLAWSGPAGALEARFAVPTLEAEARGRLGLDSGRLDPDLAVSVAKADLAELAPALGRTPLPVSAVFRLVRQDETLRAEAIEGSVAGIAVSGALAVDAPGPASKLSGELNVARLDLPTLAAALVGRSTPAGGTPAKTWSAEPFGKSALPALELDLRLATPHLVLSDAVSVADARLALAHATPRSELVLTAGMLAGGTAQGRLVLTKAPGGVGADLHLALADAGLDLLLPGAVAKPTGRLWLELGASGTGRAPAELVRTLAGRGTARVEALAWPGLAPAALGAAADLAARPRLPGESEVRGTVATALAGGALNLAKAETTLAVLGGQLRAGPSRVDGTDVAVRGVVAIDLAAMTLRGDIALAPRSELLPGSPEIGVHWTGPVAAPDRSLDVAAVVTALTQAAADRAAKVREEKAREEKAREEQAIVGAIPPEPPVRTPALVPLPPPRPQAAPAAVPAAAPADATAETKAEAKPEVKPEPAAPQTADDTTGEMPATAVPVPPVRPQEMPAAKRPAKRSSARSQPPTPDEAATQPEPFLIDRLKRTLHEEQGRPAVE